MSYPGAKVHRRNRRKLGRGQPPNVAIITTVMTGTPTTATATFSDAVNVAGTVPLAISGGGTVGPMSIVSPTVITWTIAGGSTSSTVTLANNPANALGQRGQPITGGSVVL